MRSATLLALVALFALGCGDGETRDGGPDGGALWVDAGPPPEIVEETLALRHGGALAPDARWDLKEKVRPTDRFSLSFILRVDERPTREALVVSRWEKRGRSFAIGFTDDQDITLRLSVDGRRALLLRADRHVPLGQEVLVTAVFSPRDYVRLYLGGELVDEHLRYVPSSLFDPPRVATSFGGVRGVVREVFITPRDIDAVEVKARAERWDLTRAPAARQQRNLAVRAVSDLARLQVGVAALGAGRVFYLAPHAAPREIFSARGLESRFGRGALVVNVAGFARKLVEVGPPERPRLARVDAVDHRGAVGVGVLEGINGHRRVARVALSGGAPIEPLFEVAALGDAVHQPALVDPVRALSDFQFSPSGERFAFVERCRTDKKLTRLWTSSLDPGDLELVYFLETDLVGGYAWLDEGHIVFFDPRASAYVALAIGEDDKRRFAEGPRPLWGARLSLYRDGGRIVLLTSDTNRRVLHIDLEDVPVTALPPVDAPARRGELTRFGPLGFPPAFVLNDDELVFVGPQGLVAATLP